MKSFKKMALGALIITVGISSVAAAAPYEVKPGDSFWRISQNQGVTLSSILEENNADEETIIYPGQIIQIPERKKVTTSSRGGISRGTGAIINNEESEQSKKNKEAVGNGEYLDWFKEVDKLVPIGAEFKATDFYTGKSFMVKRTVGSFHADCEALTLEDTNIMKEIWGELSWERRPAIIDYNGRKIACSITSMPHAGNDKDKGGTYTTWRSGGYGEGTNFDYVKENGMDGHFDIHFAGSKRHKDGKVDEKHQQMIKIAAGLLE